MGRRRYDQKTKEAVTHAICEKGESTSGVSKAHDIPLKTVEKWVTAYHKDHGIYKEPSKVEKNEAQLKWEIARLRRDNEILKKRCRFSRRGK